MMRFGKAVEQGEQTTVLLETLLAELRHGGTVVGGGIETAVGGVTGSQHAVGKGREGDETYAQLFKYREKPFVVACHHGVTVLYGGHRADGTYRQHREVSYYADRLCVTSKYLSEVSKKVSGYAANYWINRYTALDIARLLKDKSLTFVRISDMFGFSSPAYFSRYVQRNLGMNPTEYRE